jgi:hypothetical protein
VIKFEEVDSGLYLHSTEHNASNTNISAYSFPQLVSENKSNFTRTEVEGADRARELYRKMGMPGYTYFFHLLQTNYIHNCPLTTDDAKRALQIYGPEVATIKGKTTRQSPVSITHKINIPIPLTIQDTHPTINLSADYFYVQEVPFLHTIS